MIYADNNATSPIDPYVLEEMLPFLQDDFFNPSSPYTPARKSALAIAKARRRVAQLVDACEDEVVFTSGGTESNTWAIRLAREWNPNRNHWICSAVEHASVLEALNALEAEGHRITRIPVDKSGHLDLDVLEQAMTPDTALISVMMANNETGIIHPVREVAKMASARGIPIHTDASQAIGRVAVSFRSLGVDLMTCCAHKMHGPKGIGAILIRAGRRCAPMLHGGGQENGRRAGTENVPAIVGFGAAAERARGGMASELRDIVEKGIKKLLPDALLVGEHAQRLPNTSLFLIPGLDTDVLLAALDMAGVCASSGSACASGSSEPSHVLRAMGLLDGSKAAAVRVSWGRLNQVGEAKELVETLSRTVMEILAHERGPRS
jgi:cysteine desulfurase